MYKVPIHVLEGIISSLEQSNLILRRMVGHSRTSEVYDAIAENNKQIELIKRNFGFNENKG